MQGKKKHSLILDINSPIWGMDLMLDLMFKSIHYYLVA